MLEKYFEGRFYDDADADPSQKLVSDSVQKTEPGVSDASQLLEEKVEPRQDLPPLFVNLSDRCSRVF